MNRRRVAALCAIVFFGVLLAWLLVPQHDPAEVKERTHGDVAPEHSTLTTASQRMALTTPASMTLAARPATSASSSSVKPEVQAAAASGASTPATPAAHAETPPRMKLIGGATCKASDIGAKCTTLARSPAAQVLARGALVQSAVAPRRALPPTAGSAPAPAFAASPSAKSVPVQVMPPSRLGGAVAHVEPGDSHRDPRASAETERFRELATAMYAARAARTASASAPEPEADSIRRLAGEEGGLETCPNKLGVLAVSEPQEGSGDLSLYGLGSPATLLRQMAQSSGCFDVIGRDVASASPNTEQPRWSLAWLADRYMPDKRPSGSGQGVVADYVLTPGVITIRGSDTRGPGLGALLPGTGRMERKAETSLTIIDERMSIRLAIAQDGAANTDFHVADWAWAKADVGADKGYTKSPDGQAVAASLLKNFNKVVLAIRNYESVIKVPIAPGNAESAPPGSITASLKVGDALMVSVDKVDVYNEPSRGSKVLATLTRTSGLVALGEVKNGFVSVDTSGVFGWVLESKVSLSPSRPQAPAAASRPEAVSN